MQRRTIFLAILCVALLLGAVPTVFGQGSDVTHVVQPGENLFRIALRYGVSVQAVAQANNLANPNLIYVGQSLKIPAAGTTPPPTNQPTTTPATQTPPPASGSTYTVAAGDNLSRIAQRFGTTVPAIAQANNIANVNLIYVGQVLKIPAGGTVVNLPTGGGTTPPAGGGATPVPGGSSAFELGGHVNTFANVNEMRSARITWAKIQVRYNLGDNTDNAARAINEAHLNGFKSLLGVVGNPADIARVGIDAYIPQFAQYVGNVASLGPFAIEVWNEPNIDREWPAGQISPQNYTRLLQAAYQAIKAAKPEVMVISGAPAPTGFFGNCTGAGCDDNLFLRGMAQANAASYMDCIGAHYNEGILSPTQRSGDPRGNSGHYTRYFGSMLDTYSGAFGGSKPVCWTELGYLTMEGLGAGAPAGFEWAANTTLQQQALWLGEAAQLSRSSNRVRMMIVWNVNFTSTAPDPSGGYAIVRPGGNCPACSTLAQAMR